MSKVVILFKILIIDRCSDPIYMTTNNQLTMAVTEETRSASNCTRAMITYIIISESYTLILS